jgi:hypothetical protein
MMDENVTAQTGASPSAFEFCSPTSVAASTPMKRLPLSDKFNQLNQLNKIGGLFASGGAKRILKSDKKSENMSDIKSDKANENKIDSKIDSKIDNKIENKHDKKTENVKTVTPSSIKRRKPQGHYMVTTEASRLDSDSTVIMKRFVLWRSK